MTEKLERILPTVQKPARYVGGEYGQTMKDKRSVELRVAFCFPDTYEIGMSNLGMRILYAVMNRMEGVWCERVFAPWGDMEDAMRANGLPLYALESGDPVSEFDLIAFTIGYEMSYTNVLNMLRLSGVPLHAADRTGLEHMVFAGGACVYNPEPLADFIDFFSVGEGEESTPEILELYRRAKREGWSRPEFLRAVAQIEGVYVPSLYRHEWNADGTLASVTPLDGAPARVTKRIVQDLDTALYPTDGIVPNTEIVHDRSNLEVMRGCIRGCRFCQAGYTYRPVRPRSPETLRRQAIESLENSGCHEITLSSLSTSDYRGLPELADAMLDYCAPRKINLSLPSLRADNFSRDLMLRLQQVRKSGLTFAPEAGTQRLRDAINKNVTEQEILDTCAIAFEGGWNNVKLYFMLGLPTETDEDVLGIAELADRVVHCWRENSPNRSHGLRVTVSTSCFVPKPHTPFQWEPQVTREEYMRRVTLLRDNMKARAVTYNWHDADTSLTEAVLSRGDRRLGAMIENIWRQGGFLESWSEGFDLKRWERAAEEEGISFPFYANRERSLDEVLPWDHLYMGVNRRHYIHEYEQAHQGLLSPDCRAQCSGCGAAAFLKGGRCDG